MKLPDGRGWSPDGGAFQVKGHMLYWEDGDSWDMRDGRLIRVLDCGEPMRPGEVDYSTVANLSQNPDPHPAQPKGQPQ